MNKLSTTLTMTLLLGTTLNAANEHSLAIYNPARGAPTGAGALVVARQSLVAYNSNQTPTNALALAVPEQIYIPTSAELLSLSQQKAPLVIWAEITDLANLAKRCFNPEALMKIKQLQQQLLTLQRFKDCSKLQSVNNQDIQDLFCAALNNAKEFLKAERAVELWSSQKQFLEDNKLIGRQPYYLPTDTMLETIYGIAIDQATLGNIDYLLELWELQRSVLLALPYFPKKNVISSSEINTGFKTAAANARELGELLALWRIQEAFLIANPSVYCPKYDLIATIVDTKIQAEIASAQRTGKTQRVAELTQIKSNLLTAIHTAPVPIPAETIKHMSVLAALQNKESTLKSVFYSFSAALQPYGTAPQDESALDTSASAALQPYGTAPQDESALDTAAKIIALGHGNFHAHPKWKTVYSTLRDVYSKAIANGDALTATIAFSYLFEFRHCIEEFSYSNLNRDKLRQVINDFISSAHETRNPFRLVAAYGLYDMRMTIPDLVQTPEKRVVESFASLTNVQDLNLLNDMYAVIAAFCNNTRNPSTDLQKALMVAHQAYEDTKPKLESLKEHTGGDAAAGARTSFQKDELSVRALVAKYGEDIETSSLEEMRGSFSEYYKTANLRLHPDKNQGATEKKLKANKDKLDTLQSFKAWVDNLTEAEFAASPKV